MHRQPWINRKIFGPLYWPLTLGLIAIVAAPLAYAILISLTPDSEVRAGNLLPTTVKWHNYVRMWSTLPLARDLANSLVVCLASGCLAVLLGLGLAYGLSRFAFRGRKGILIGLLCAHSIPHVMLLLPLFVLLASIQQAIHTVFIGSRWALVLVYLTFALPFAGWLIFTYLAGVGEEVEEAARLDGCTRFQVLYHIVVPMIRPAIAVSFVFSFLTAWSDVLFASVLTDKATRTVAVGVQTFIGQSSGEVFWGQLLAASLLNAAIVATLFAFCQRYLVGGLTAGAVQ